LIFWQILKDKNVLLLDSEYKEGKKYSKAQLNEMQETWLRLYDEYYVLLDDSQSRAKMKNTFSELELRDKINQIKYNYDFLVNLLKCENDIDVSKYEQETYARLKLIDKRIKPKYFEGIQANLDNLNRVIKSLVNKYNTEHKNNTKAVEKEIQNVYDVVASAESWLERTLPIDDIVVTRWISYQKQIKDKQKAHQKNGK
jgi:hypothetical protein